MQNMPTVLSDRIITALCKSPTVPMIYPFIPHSVSINEDGESVLSYGVSSYGYDVRANGKWTQFKEGTETLDIRTLNEDEVIRTESETFVLQPGDFVMTVTKERFCMPDNVLATVLTKSTYARMGVVCIATPLEPGWEGHITLEYANLTKRPVMLFANQGIAQVVFQQGTAVDTTYGDRAGKYQNQPAEVVLPRLK